MGTLSHFDLQHYIDTYKTSVYVETGTGKGLDLKHALQFPFKKWFSCEISPELWYNANEKFQHYDKGLYILPNNSEQFLKTLSFPIGTNILFWLDAHLPGVDYNIPHDDTPDHIKMPLETELNLIRYNFRGGRHVILIDDLRFYEEGEYEAGNLDPQWRKPNCDFVWDLFSESHHIIRHMKDEGYLELLPKRRQIS